MRKGQVFCTQGRGSRKSRLDSLKVISAFAQKVECFALKVGRSHSQLHSLKVIFALKWSIVVLSRSGAHDSQHD